MSLVDFKFEKLIAQKVIRVLYAVVFALLTLYVVVGVIAVVIAFRDSGTPLLALLAVAGVILLYFLVLLFTRVWYESMIIRFQMAEDIREIRKKYLA
jgi:membrane protein YdbS with pleckstrin-like domain